METVKAITVSIPEGVQVAFARGMLTLTGANGTEKRKLPPTIVLEAGGAVITLSSTQKGKRSKKELGTWKSHITNMLKGVSQGHSYTLKICASHFPMNVTADKGKVVVKNFMGEKVPREYRLPEGVSVKVNGQEIHIESTSKERAGNVASGLEKLTHRPAYDRRIFQDGIYITNKDGKAIV